MRRQTTTRTIITRLLSLTKPTNKTPFTRTLTTQIPHPDDKKPFSQNTHLTICKKTQSLLISPKFNQNPHHSFTTQANEVTQMPSRQRKLIERSQLEAAFEAAETSEDMLVAFGAMEENFDEKDLGLACLKIGLKLDQDDDDPEKVLSYAKRALAILDSENVDSTNDNVNGSSLFPVAMSLQLLGSTSYSLKRFSDALGYLSRANKILTRLEQEGKFSEEDIMPVMHAVQLELANTKNALGRREEALENLRKSVEIKKVLLGKDSREVGNAYRDLAEAYVAILNFREALPCCLKAVEVHTAQLGQNSVEVAHDRRLLGVIYTGMEKHEEALEQNRLAQKVLKTWGKSSDLLRAEIDAANMQIALGRFEVAVNTLKGVVAETEKDSEDRALILITMGKALVSQDNYPDAKRCLEIACGIFDKKEMAKPIEAAEAYMEISMQYETMNDFEVAISLLKRALALLERIPQEQHSVGSVSARIGWLLLLTGKVSQAIPFLESAAETLKDCFGPKHFGVGYIYNNMGAAYLEMDRPESAAQMFAVAKDIMDVSLGPHHADSIDACQNLSKAYATMKSYDLAIEFLQKAIDAWKGHGKSAEEEIKEACRLLDQLKVQAAGGIPRDFSTKALPLPHNYNSSRGVQPSSSSGATQ